MSYAHGTPNFNLPQTRGSDKRDWSDTNAAFLAVDTALKTAGDNATAAGSAASTAQSTANNAATAASNAQSTANGAASSATAAAELATTAKNRADSAYTLANTAKNKANAIEDSLVWSKNWLAPSNAREYLVLIQWEGIGYESQVLPSDVLANASTYATIMFGSASATVGFTVGVQVNKSNGVLTLVNGYMNGADITSQITGTLYCR